VSFQSFEPLGKGRSLLVGEFLIVLLALAGGAQPLDLPSAPVGDEVVLDAMTLLLAAPLQQPSTRWESIVESTASGCQTRSRPDQLRVSGHSVFHIAF